jgi:prefoldin subunit 5
MAAPDGYNPTPLIPNVPDSQVTFHGIRGGGKPEDIAAAQKIVNSSLEILEEEKTKLTATTKSISDIEKEIEAIKAQKAKATFSAEFSNTKARGPGDDRTAKAFDKRISDSTTKLTAAKSELEVLNKSIEEKEAAHKQALAELENRTKTEPTPTGSTPAPSTTNIKTGIAPINNIIFIYIYFKRYSVHLVRDLV